MGDFYDAVLIRFDVLVLLLLDSSCYEAQILSTVGNAWSR